MIALHPNITTTYCGLMPAYHSVLNVKALVGTFNRKKVLVGAFSVIVITLPMVRLQLYLDTHVVHGVERVGVSLLLLVGGAGLLGGGRGEGALQLLVAHVERVVQEAHLLRLLRLQVAEGRLEVQQRPRLVPAPGRLPRV